MDNHQPTAELIQINVDEQGPKVRSARELHSFLEVKSKFADWFKNRVKKYSFIDGQDFVTLSKNLESGDEGGYSKNLEKGGRPELDYALTLDMAKELSMVERNEKGKQARQYFIEAEKALRQLAAPALSIEQVALQQAHTLVEHSNLIAQLRAEIDSIKSGVRLIHPSTPPPHLKQTPQFSGPPKRPASSLRQAVKNRVNEYCGTHGYEHSDTYNYLYKRLHELWGINIQRLIRANGESILDTIERYGHLDKLYTLIVAELNYIEE